MNHPLHPDLKKIAEIDEKIRLLQQKKRAERSCHARKQRDVDNRRKLLIGKAIDALVKREPERESWLVEQLDNELTGDSERTFMKLPPKVPVGGSVSPNASNNSAV